MGVMRLPQRSFSSGELDERFGGLADTEQYARGLRSAIGVIFNQLGGFEKRYGSFYQVDLQGVTSSRVIGFEPPGAGQKALVVQESDIKCYDVATRVLEATISWGSLWTGTGMFRKAIAMPLDNTLWLFHPQQPTVVITRNADATWSAVVITSIPQFTDIRLAPRNLSTTMTPSSSGAVLTAGTDYFVPEDGADPASGAGTIWFIGRGEAATDVSGWIRATEYLSRTVLKCSGLGDRKPTDGKASIDWTGPWELDLSSALANAITFSGTLTIEGDCTATLSGGDVTDPLAVGALLAVNSSTSRHLLLIRKRVSSTVYDCRVIDANGGSIPSPSTTTSYLWRLRSREYDGHYLMPENEDTDGENLFSSAPIMASGMSVSGTDRDARFDLGNGKELGRVTSFLDVNNVTVNWEIKLWTERDLAPRVNWSPLMSDYHGWPGLGCEHQGRVALAGFPLYPRSIVFSRTHAPYNYVYGVEDDSAFVFTKIPNAAGAVSWMVSDRDLLVGTTRGEHLVSGEPLTPTDALIARQTSYGGMRDRAVVVGGAALFVTRSGRGVREMTFRFDSDRFQAPDLTDLNKLLSGLAPSATILRQPTFAVEPNPLVLMVGDANQINALTYRRDNGVVAWSRWKLSLKSGEAEAFRDACQSVEAVNASTERDEIWMATARRIDQGSGGEWFYALEIMSDLAIFDCQTDVVSPGSTTVTGLGQYASREVAVVADGKWLGLYTVSGGGSLNLSDKLASAPALVNVGYEIPCEVEPQVLQIDDPRSGASDCRRRTIKDTALVLSGSYGGEVGWYPGSVSGVPVEKFDPIFPEIVPGTTLLSARFSGVKRMPVNIGGEEARPIIRSRGPWPFRLSAVCQGVEIGD